MLGPGGKEWPASHARNNNINFIVNNIIIMCINWKLLSILQLSWILNCAALVSMMQWLSWRELVTVNFHWQFSMLWCIIVVHVLCHIIALIIPPQWGWSCTVSAGSSQSCHSAWSDWISVSSFLVCVHGSYSACMCLSHTCIGSQKLIVVCPN